MENIYKNSFNSIFESKDKSIDPGTDFNYQDHIIRNGKAVYNYDGFNLNAFASSVKLHLFNELNQETNSKNISENIIEITYNSKDGIAEKLNVGKKFKITLLMYDNILYFYIDIADATDKPNEKHSILSVSSWLNDSKKKEISLFIYETIYGHYIKKHPEKKLNFNNKYIDDTHLNERMFIHNITQNEIILAKLNISSIISDIMDLSTSENASFILTDKDSCIVAFNKQGEAIIFEQISRGFKINKRIGKNSFKYNTITWYPKRSNASLFNDLEGIFNHTGFDRIKELSRLNYLNEEYQSAEDLMMMLAEKEDDPVNNLCMMFIKSKKEQNTNDNYFSNEQLEKNTGEILTVEDSELRILEAFETWNIDYNKKTMFLNLFSNLVDTPEEREKILPLYESVREEFLKKNKNQINQTVFDIKYAEFLISSGHKRKAAGILKKVSSHLPDETTSDLLPLRTLNLAGDQSGQLLRITILDLYAQAKGKESSADQIQKTVQLQPLNKDRLTKLADVKNDNLSKKAQDILSVLNENGLTGDIGSQEIKDFNQPDDKTLDTLRHPATIKTGSFYSIQKWTSKVKTEDYTSLKNYSEKINSENNQDIFNLIENIRKIFRIETAEYYISKGDRNRNIIGYEGTIPFIIFGHEHLNLESELYLNPSEIQFAVASEFAHIFFKHSKISSQDVWRGVSEKGYFLIDALLSAIPAAGLLAKSVQNVPKLSKLALIIRSTDKVIAGSKNIYDASMKLSEFYQKKFKSNSKEEKEQNLLAASRLMQFTADRAGLSISGDLRSAVRTIFLTGKYNFNLFDEVQKTSLEKLILKVNNDGTYKHQELAIRLTNLFSYYISDEYDAFRKKLIRK